MFAHGHALLVGVGADLPKTVDDATAIAEVLKEPTRAGYDPGHVDLITGERATREGILGAFAALEARVLADPDATVVVYYSGHGGMYGPSMDEARYFLVPYGFDPLRRAETGISDEEFSAAVARLRCKKLVVLLDCCHAAGLPQLKDTGLYAKQDVPASIMENLAQGEGKVVLASCRHDELARVGSRYSYFTEVLLEALEGKAGVRRGMVRVLDVIAYLIDEVPQRVQGQHPYLNKVEKLSENFALCMAEARPAVEDVAAVARIPWWNVVERIRSRWLRRALTVEFEELVVRAGRLRLDRALADRTATAKRPNPTLDAAQGRLNEIEAELHELDLRTRADPVPPKFQIGSVVLMLLAACLVAWANPRSRGSLKRLMGIHTKTLLIVPDSLMLHVGDFRNRPEECALGVENDSSCEGQRVCIHVRGIGTFPLPKEGAFFGDPPSAGTTVKDRTLAPKRCGSLDALRAEDIELLQRHMMTGPSIYDRCPIQCESKQVPGGEMIRCEAKPESCTP